MQNNCKKSWNRYLTKSLRYNYQFCHSDQVIVLCFSKSKLIIVVDYLVMEYLATLHLNDGRPVNMSVYLLGSGGHVGDGVEVVHLRHGHGYRSWRQPHRQQWVGHHHEGQVQS